MSRRQIVHKTFHDMSNNTVKDQVKDQVKNRMNCVPNLNTSTS